MKEEQEKKCKDICSNDKEICRIEYNNWGRHFADRMWCAILPNGEALDYGSLELCKRSCEEEGMGYIVIRHHRNKTQSVVDYKPSPTRN